MSDQLNRVFLWCIPRTVSTALTKCLGYVEGLQVVNEPYASAFHAGPERKAKDLDMNDSLTIRLAEITDRKQSDRQKSVDGLRDEMYSYAWIRDELLGGSYEDKNILLCKDMAFHLQAKYHMLPTNFKYSFLIRHPAKVFLSWKKSMNEAFGETCAAYLEDIRKLPDFLFPEGFGFKELYELMVYVEKTLGQKPVVLDMDDLLTDPPGIVSAYCREMGIPYSPELLSWEAGESIPETWIASQAMMHANKLAGFFDVALMSTGFKHPKPPPSIDSLPADLQACVEASQWYYKKLRERRIKAAS